MRIVAIQSIAQWTGAIEEQEYLVVPAHMDIPHEEEIWFSAGGGLPKDFVVHLIARGAIKLSVETWTIRYQ